MESPSSLEPGELEWTLFEQDGVLRSAQAIRLIGSAGVRRRLRRGVWRRACFGVLVAHDGPLTYRQQLWVAVFSAGAGACLAGGAAAAESGVRGLRNGALQVIIPGERRSRTSIVLPRRDMPEVHVYRSKVLPEDHLQLSRPPRTSVARSVIDAAAWAASDEEARTIICAACRQRRVAAGDLRKVLAFFPTIRRHRLIAATITDIEGGAESLLEIDFGSLGRRYDLPPPSWQRLRRDATGRVRYLDACWEEQRVQVEVDGSLHIDVRRWAGDMMRQNQLPLRGNRILRFPGWLIRKDPTAVAAQLKAALARVPRRTAARLDQPAAAFRPRAGRG